MLATLHRFHVWWLVAVLQVAVWTRAITRIVHYDDSSTHALSESAPHLTPSWQPFKSKQYVRYNKRGTKQVMKAIQSVHRVDMTDLNDDDIFTQHRSGGTLEDKHEILELLRRVGITEVDDETADLLPTWKDVTDLYGDLSADHPIYAAGLETCQRFRDTVPPGEAFLGTAGMFNSGTNALTYYLRANLKMPSVPHRDDSHHNGILTQVPWDKHYFASLRESNTADSFEAYSKEHVLPIVIIRDPLTWLHSMCATPYMVQSAARSSDERKQWQQACRHLTPGSDGISIPAMTEKTWPSLLHLWNDWYREYLHDYKDPFLMVRFEDLLFRPRAVLDVIRECPGAVWAEEDAFTYVVDQSKWEHVRFHGPQSNMVSAMIKHGNAARRVKGLTPHDLRAARDVLDPELMKIFGYHYPS